MKSFLVCLLLVLVSPSQQYGETDQRAGGERIGGTIVCHLAIDPGNCEDLSLLPSPTVRYGYDRSKAGCIQFVYSGCGGNANRFTSYNQCLTTCIPPEVSYNDFLTLLQYLNRQSI